jgi:sterol desaturase/sphingolipid hydroxylase (fatty acid hydroxylase superfamily)
LFAHRYSYVGVLLISLLVLWWGVVGPYPIEYVSLSLQVVMVLLILGLEILIPFTRSWGDIRNLTRADAIYFTAAFPFDQLQIFLLVTLLAGTQQYHHYIQVVDFWPKNAPVLLQALMAVLIVDFFKYWYHRWTHTIPLLWRYHLIHHCLERLEMLRASYFFPLDIILTQAIGTFFLLLCGAPYEIIVFHNVFAGITGLLNHCNVDLRCGVLDVILNSPGHHRAHHEVDLRGCDSNYGSFFNFADRIFGTRYLPEDQSTLRVEPLGLDDTYDIPDTVLKQLAVPFRWSSVHRES